MKKLSLVTKITFLFFLALLTSCKMDKKDKPHRLYLAHSFMWATATADDTYEDAIEEYENFSPLYDMTTKNIQHIFADDGNFGLSGHYLWIRADFSLPDYLKHQSLGLSIPYLRMADKTYVNGNFVGSLGNFPPNEYSALYSAHNYVIPEGILNQEGNNTILIKIWSHGQSGISKNTFISTVDDARTYSELVTFFYTRIYFYFQGGLFLTILLFSMMSVAFGCNRSYKFFALVNLTTMSFMTAFFSPELAVNHAFNLSYFWFMKISFSTSLVATFYLLSDFIAEFINYKQSHKILSIRLILFLIFETIIISTRNYDDLMKITIPMIFVIIAHISFGIYFWLKSLLRKETRREALILIQGFVPVLFGIIIDISVRKLSPDSVFPFFSLFSWQGTIIFFIIVLSRRAFLMYKENIVKTIELKDLNENLEKKVIERTHELKDANYELSVLNARLEKEKFRSELELEMASIVQRKFFPQPIKHFKGWDIAICYEPLAKVSGDLYDYYNFKNILNGISIFDVSGHGISASLITMLSKNIISHAFQRGYRNRESIEHMLNRINNSIITEKGEIDNYLTGLLCRFSEFDEKDICTVELGNAGHPYPLHYNANEKLIKEIKQDEKRQHYGAIGMRGLDVSFPEIKFTMGKDDLFVCYTDGLTESSNNREEQFGLNRVKQIVSENHDKSPEEILKILTDKLQEFIGEQPIEDDITIMILKRTDSSVVQELEPEELDFEVLEEIK